jgi:hypothetical protein
MRLKHILIGLSGLLFAAAAMEADTVTWVRAYGENLEPAYVYARAGHAVVARNDEILTIDSLGTPIRAATVGKRWQLVVGPKGEIVRADFEGNSLVVERLERDLTSGSKDRYEFSARLLPRALAAAADGRVFVAATRASASIVFQLSADGSPKWATELNPSSDGILTAIAATRDGGCVAAGSRTGYAWIVKLDGNGRVQWHRTYAYATGGFESVLETATEEIVTTGELDGQLAVVRFTKTGATVWQRLYSGVGTGFSIAETAVGSFVIGGTGVGDWSLFALLEVKADGSAGWKRRLSAPKSNPMNLANKNVVAVAGPAILVAPPRRIEDKRVIVMSVDAASGSSSCDWWTDLGGEWSKGNIAGEILPFETDSVTASVKFTRTAAKLTATTIVSSTFSCDTKPVTAAVSSPPTSASFDPSARTTKLQERYFALVRNKELDELDKEADRLRRDHPFEDPFWWDIDIFYDAVVSLPGTTEAQRTQFMRDWVAARPDSVTAKVALAKVLVRAASARRGTGFSNTVTDLAWKQYTTLMQEAQSTLAKAGKAAEADPQYWLMQVGFDHQLEGVDVRETVRRAAKLHHYSRIFTAASQYMLPKWGGTAADYLAFADEAARLTERTFGDALYAMAALYVRTDDDFAQLYEPKIDWARVRKGLRDLIATAPEWAPGYHSVARLARYLNDRALAREIFLKPQSAWYDAAAAEWGSRAHYDSVRKWALSEPLEPFVKTDRSTWPSIVMQTQLVLSTGTHNRNAAFLLETPAGVSAVSVVPVIENRPDSVSAVGKTRQQFLKWVAWPVGRPDRRVELSIAAVSSENAARATLLALPPSKTSPTHVLKPATTEWFPRDAFAAHRRFVVGCTWAGDSCNQTIIEVEPQGGESDPSGRPRRHRLGVRQSVPADALIGAAVLDEDGRVVGVVTGQSRSYNRAFPILLDADDLSMVLATSKPAPTSASSAVSFTASPFAKWPALVMQSNSVGGNVASFLVETPTGVVGVTVDPEKRLAQLIEKPGRSTWAVQPLTLRPLDQPLPMGGVTFIPNRPFEPNCFVVGCLWSDGKCIQTVIEGKLVGGSPTRQQISLPAPIEKDSLVGGAVMDRDGKVFAVVTGASPREMGAERYLIDAALLGALLPRN